MERYSLPYKNSSIHYLKFGRGTKFLFCLHGYGEEAASFLFLENALGNDYTLIAPDLPYHGATDWKEGPDFGPSDLKNIIEAIVPLGLQTISFLGYSMGGRVALAMLQEIPASVERIVLVAPDGLRQNFWYWLSTQTNAGNKLFSYTMRNPHWFFGGMRVLENIKMLNKSISRFAHAYLDDPREREMLYRRWTALRKFRPRNTRLKNILSRGNVTFKMLFGAYDRIIPRQWSASLAGSKNVTVHSIHAGHQLLRDKYAKDIAALFYDK